MAAAARLAAARGMIGPAEVGRIERLIERAELPSRLLPYSADEYWRAMGSDKKVREGKIAFILPERIGKVTTVRDVSEAEAHRCLE